VVTIVLFPPHAFGGASELFDGAAGEKANGSVERVHDEILAGLDVKFFANGFGYDDLEFGRNADAGSLHEMKPPEVPSMETS
jgi:hypothetical protein